MNQSSKEVDFEGSFEVSGLMQFFVDLISGTQCTHVFFIASSYSVISLPPQSSRRS